MERTAIIDLGSNTVRLVVYEIKKTGSYLLVESLSDTIRLASNIDEQGNINDITIKKTIEVITMFKRLCTTLGVEKENITGVATAAVRIAKNNKHLVDCIYKESGLHFKIISGAEEAGYDFIAVNRTFNIKEYVAIDIGGGSTEIVHIKDREIINLVSIQLGSVSLYEQYFKNNKNDEPAGVIEALLDAHPWLKKLNNLPVIGIGGTIRNIAYIYKTFIKYPLSIVNNYHMTAEDLNITYSVVNKYKKNEIKKLEGVSEKREDIMVAGTYLFRTIFEYTNARELFISAYGIREGLLFEKLHKKNQLLEKMTTVEFSLYNIFQYFDIREKHAKNVEKISKMLFKSLSELHGYKKKEEKILSYAALLHDIGTILGYDNHHYHSFYIILNQKLNGLSHKEVLMIAIIAALHSKESFKTDWQREFKSLLDKKDIVTIRILALILASAEALDLSENSAVKIAKCEVEDKSIYIKLKKLGSCDAEIRSFMDLACEYKKILKKRLVIKS
jgi:exopolyphosphatase/guanosine-5'-triphosphate,3'-diphosphate pyrophosphatase